MDVISKLEAIVGKRYVLTSAGSMRRYCQGYRIGRGQALAIVRPACLVEQWRVADICVSSGLVVVMQAANTGLTGGSTPFGEYDRDVVVISTMRIKGIHLIGDGQQAVCLPGATLFELDRLLAPLNREPHSEIGSSCLGATVHGGICNNSGGALIRRGPAYTEAALFAKVGPSGRLELVNHLGIDLGGTPEEILGLLDRGELPHSDLEPQISCSRRDYIEHVSRLDEDTPARFNADPRNLFEASGSAGKVVVFAVRVDTFEREANPQVVHVASTDPDVLTDLKHRLMESKALVPIAGEYMHRDMFETALRYGRDMFTAISLMGTGRLPALFAVKNGLDQFTSSLPFKVSHLSDRVLQVLGKLLPYGLSKRLQRLGRAYEHHLFLKLQTSQLEKVMPLLNQVPGTGHSYVELCSGKDGKELFLHRFVAAGAAIREDILRSKGRSRLIALDIALRRNDEDWHEFLPDELSKRIEKQLVYGHFFCNVLHLDFIAKAGEDTESLKDDILYWYAARGAEYPAEHNVGHAYVAPPQLSSFYKSLDPTNTFNAGIGKTSRSAGWR